MSDRSASEVALRTILSLSLGSGTAAVLWLGLKDTFAAPIFSRLNYRNAAVPVGAGLIVALATVIVEAVCGVLGAEAGRVPMVLIAAVIGFGLLGFVDDVAAVGHDKGFRGHLGALAHGRLTTGGLKLIGGGFLAIAVGVAIEGDRPGRVLLDASLIALAANLGNLFDRAPGRTIKVAVLGLAALWIAAPTGPLPAVAVAVGAGIGLVTFDLHEELMLGDAGANALGAALGTGVVLAFDVEARIGVAAVLLALNLISELVSFSAVIERIGPLRALDVLGRRRSPG